MGDEVLRAFAADLQKIPGAVAVRDGGDEFIVMGAPTETGLEEKLDEFRMRSWPQAFRGRFGSEVADVAPRILVTTTHAAEIVAARDQLGREIGPWKKLVDPVPPTGALRRIEPQAEPYRLF
jgi:hypothetical protein